MHRGQRQEVAGWREKNGARDAMGLVQVNQKDGIGGTEVTLTLQQWQDANQYDARKRTYGKR